MKSHKFLHLMSLSFLDVWTKVPVLACSHQVKVALVTFVRKQGMTDPDDKKGNRK